MHCDEQNCRKDKNGDQECRSRIHTFQATPNGYISIEEQMAIEEKVSKLKGSNYSAFRTWGPRIAWAAPYITKTVLNGFIIPDFEIF